VKKLTDLPERKRLRQATPCNRQGSNELAADVRERESKRAKTENQVAADKARNKDSHERTEKDGKGEKQIGGDDKEATAAAAPAPAVPVGIDVQALLQLLPEDAPPNSDAHNKCKETEDHRGLKVVRFWGHFPVGTVNSIRIAKSQCADSTEVLLRIARICFRTLENGATKEECYELRNACMQTVREFISPPVGTGEPEQKDRQSPLTATAELDKRNSQSYQVAAAQIAFTDVMSPLGSSSQSASANGAQKPVEVLIEQAVQLPKRGAAKVLVRRGQRCACCYSMECGRQSGASPSRPAL